MKSPGREPRRAPRPWPSATCMRRCRRENEGRPSSPRATISPSRTHLVASPAPRRARAAPGTTRSGRCRCGSPRGAGRRRSRPAARIAVPLELEGPVTGCVRRARPPEPPASARATSAGARSRAAEGSIRWIIQFLPLVVEQHVAALHPLAVEDDHDLACAPLLALVGAPVPDRDRSRRRTRPAGSSPLKMPYSRGWSSTWTARWFSLGVEGEPLRERPGSEHPVPFEAEVPVQARGVVLLDDEGGAAARPGSVGDHGSASARECPIVGLVVYSDRSDRCRPDAVGGWTTGWPRSVAPDAERTTRCEGIGWPAGGCHGGHRLPVACSPARRVDPTSRRLIGIGRLPERPARSDLARYPPRAVGELRTASGTSLGGRSHRDQDDKDAAGD